MNLEARIERLLDQLENPNLSVVDIDRIRLKLDLLQSQHQQAQEQQS